MKIKATVKIRRGGDWEVKPSAECVDGIRHTFTEGWEATEDDTSIYVGETVWIPARHGWPDEAPTSISSGDLVDVVEIYKEQ